MLIDSIDINNKTIFHEILSGENYNSLSIMDYNTNTTSKNFKINNCATLVIDICAINDSQLLTCYFSPTVNKLVCKIITILDDLSFQFGPSFTIDIKTSTTRVSIVNLNKTESVIFYNDNTNDLGKAIIIKHDDTNITTINSYTFSNGKILQLVAMKNDEKEVLLFFQYHNDGVTKLFSYTDMKLILIEEQKFFHGSNLYNLSMKKLKDNAILAFVADDFHLYIKILQLHPKITFTQSIKFNKKVSNINFDLISVDNEMVLCYVEGVVQIISLVNGEIIQPENI